MPELDAFLSAIEKAMISASWKIYGSDGTPREHRFSATRADQEHASLLGKISFHSIRDRETDSHLPVKIATKKISKKYSRSTDNFK